MDRQFVIEFTEKAEQDIRTHKKSGNKAAVKKIATIIEELKIHPQTGTGQPEPLRYDLSGYWARRINQKDRLIYIIERNVVTVTVISAIGHYGDK